MIWTHPIKVAHYRTPAGNEPTREWLRSLTKGVRRQIGADLAEVQWRWPIGKPLVEGMGKGLYELRSTYEKSEYRVLFIEHGELFVLLHGFVKKTQKTPPGELEIARKRKKEVESQ